ncbi:MAG: hypothetical protein ABI415_00315 [Flavitalea sp.]
MMIAIEITINVLWLVGLICLAFAFGFMLRSGKLKKCRSKILGLERDLLNSDAILLDMEKEKVILIQQMKESKIPVIPMKKTKDDSDKNEHHGRQAN